MQHIAPKSNTSAKMYVSNILQYFMKICEFNSGMNYFNDFIIKYPTSHKKDPICLSNMNVTNVKLFADRRLQLPQKRT